MRCEAMGAQMLMIFEVGFGAAESRDSAGSVKTVEVREVTLQLDYTTGAERRRLACTGTCRLHRYSLPPAQGEEHKAKTHPMRSQWLCPVIHICRVIGYLPQPQYAGRR